MKRLVSVTFFAAFFSFYLLASPYCLELLGVRSDVMVDEINIVDAMTETVLAGDMESYHELAVEYDELSCFKNALDYEIEVNCGTNLIM